MALMRGRGTPAAANVDSGRGSGLRETVDSGKKWITKKTEPAAVTGTEYPGSNKAWRIKNSLASPKWNKMDTSEVNMDYVAPSTKRYSNPDFGMGAWDGAKKGGRAGKDFGKRGGGKAKRGLGRAFTKGRK